MLESLFKVLGAGLSIWEHKERRKYIDELLRLKKEYYEVYNENPRDHGRLDVIEHRVRTIGEVFSSSVGKQDIGDS